jgi:hypothetical protein
LDFGITVLLIAMAIPFCFGEFQSQEVPEQLELLENVCLVVDF